MGEDKKLTKTEMALRKDAFECIITKVDERRKSVNQDLKDLVKCHFILNIIDEAKKIAKNGATQGKIGNYTVDFDNLDCTSFVCLPQDYRQTEEYEKRRYELESELVHFDNLFDVLSDMQRKEYPELLKDGK